MLRPACIVLGLAGLAAPATGWSQTPPSADKPAPPQSASGVDRRVIEDGSVRIEELRVRGQLQSVTVQSKVPGARPYQILLGRGGRDPSQDKSAAGQSSWSILSF